MRVSWVGLCIPFGRSNKSGFFGMCLSAIAFRPTGYSPRDIQWTGLLWSALLLLGVWTSKSSAFRFGVMSPNWLYFFERWMAYGILAMIMPMLCMLGWTTWRTVKAHAVF